MKPGNLVRITRAGLGRPLGQLGFIIKAHHQISKTPFQPGHWTIFTVRLVGAKNREIRVLKEDLILNDDYQG
jgi:hypothetical protein